MHAAPAHLVVTYTPHRPAPEAVLGAGQFTAGQKEHIRALQAELEPIRQVLQRHRWLGGSEPGYPDICLFALFTVRPLVTQMPCWVLIRPLYA